MENAVEALKMAAAVLIFVIAIGSSFSLFGTAKSTADAIITMRDKQSYLEAAELDNGILYTSSSTIQEGDSDEISEATAIEGVTTKGDRIVKVEDVISTIYRYSKEKYGVTIMDTNGDIKARYDSNTDQIMNIWNRVKSDSKINYITKLNNSTKTVYCEDPRFDEDKLKKIYNITIEGGSDSIKWGAPWYGNDEEIKKRVACDLKGENYIYNKQTHKGSEIKLLSLLNGANTIVEVVKEIDNSHYLNDTEIEGNTDLLQQYEMPTIEVVYIIIS